MKRLLALILCLALCAGLCAGCGGEKESGARVSVVTTCFALYDWARNVAGDADGVEITWLMDSGVDPHSFQPAVDDLLAVANSDVFVFVGGESDQWTADAVEGMTKPDAQAVNLLEALGDAAVAEEDDPGAKDEHVWMSIRNAQTCVDCICAALCKADPQNDDVYQMNAADYKNALQTLDGEYADAVAAAEKHAIVVADRFPFAYLAADYDLDYRAAFPGCSAESEASFQTVLHLAQYTIEEGLPVVLVTENGDGAVAEAVAETVEENTGEEPPVRTLDSLQSVTAEIAADGVTYLSLMQQNLDVLKEALVCPF